ncbi:MAG: helix-turn-helix domain-containing protein, partial [Chloroflexota bacterium]|nr:helix-turn-helix domain-containing protein [Chloroflexota bacterium]
MTTQEVPGDLLDPRLHPTLPITAACVIFDVSRSTAYTMAAAGTLPVIKISDRRMVIATARLRDMLGLPPV